MTSTSILALTRELDDDPVTAGKLLPRFRSTVAQHNCKASPVGFAVQAGQLWGVAVSVSFNTGNY